MGGIIFFKTRALVKMVEFYMDRLDMTVWVEQPDCTILKHGNMLIGFCQSQNLEKEGMITFVYDSKEEVEAMHEKLGDISRGPPKENKRYSIYQFFAADPEGRALEFQVFLHDTPKI